jgi:LmbE family N-acetylglucosaminyl deacetylase
MLDFFLNIKPNTALNVLCLGAHGDDIEIGCGGTLLKLISKYPQINIHWIVFSASPERKIETEASANQFLAPVENKHILIKNFRDGFFPYYGKEIKEYFEEIKSAYSPSLVFTHYRKDLHQDHRLICELTWNTFRDHLIMEYEIPKYDGDFGSPNLFVHLDEQICGQKIADILRFYKTQENKHWFSDETFLSIMRLRGIESRSPSNYAEAFYCRKLIQGF